MTETGSAANDETVGAKLDPLDAARRDLLDIARADAAFDGWTEQMLRGAAARMAPETAGSADILFPRGVRDVLTFWSLEEDAAMAADWAAAEIRPRKIRDKVTWLVQRRIAGLEPHREAARRAAATLALPVHGATGSRLVWRTAGAIWRTLGDRSLDGNYYSKRAILSGVYATTLSHWFANDGEGLDDPYERTWAFLDRRIDNVMQIEKAKGVLGRVTVAPATFAGTLGWLRYPGARRQG